MLKYNFLPGAKKRRFQDSEKGMALVEAIPVLFMLVVVFNFSLGFFGAIHSGILNSIGSYNYAMETFRFKSNLMYFRPGGENSNYKLSKNRVHGVTKDGSEYDDVDSQDRKNWPATVRNITFNYKKDDPKRSLSAISKGGQALCDGADCRNYDKGADGNIWKTADPDYTPEAEQPLQTPRIWIKTVYGICISADCGDENQ